MFHIESSDIVLQSLNLPARIWKVRPDPHGLAYALELRDADSKSVRYLLASSAGPDLLAGPEITGQDWWTGIEGYREGVLLLHGYEEPGLPLHRGLCAFDPATGNLLWENNSLAFEGFWGNGLLCRHGDTYYLHDLQSGDILRRVDDPRSDEVRRGLEEADAAQSRNLDFPENVWEGDARFADWVEAIGSAPFGPLSLYVQGEWQVVAWHEGEPGAFALALAIFRDGTLQLDGWLEEGMSGLHPDPFFVHAGRVVTVREQRDLVVVGLGGQ